MSSIQEWRARVALASRAINLVFFSEAAICGEAIRMRILLIAHGLGKKDKNLGHIISLVVLISDFC